MKKLIFFGVFLAIVSGAAVVYFFFQSHFEPAEKPNVLLITIDSFGTDCLNQRLMPSAMEITKGGVLFPNAITSSPRTAPSHASLITGLYPPRHGVRENSLFSLPTDIKTIAFVLKNADYRTGAFVGSSLLDRRFGFGKNFDVYEEAGEKSEAVYPTKRRAEDVARGALRWIVRGEKDIPFFVWLNFADAIYPSDPPSEFSRFPPYEAEIAYLNGTLVQIFTILGYEKLIDKTLIVIVGSHGGRFDRDERSAQLGDLAIRVPLIMHFEKKLPAGARIEKQVRIVDIFPTVAEILKIKPPTDLDGSSLLPLIKGEGGGKENKLCYLEFLEGYYSFGLSPLYGLRVTQWKYIFGSETALYNLQDDPIETENLSQSHQSELTQIKSAFDDMAKKFPSGAVIPTKDIVFSAEEYRALTDEIFNAKKLIFEGKTDSAVRALKKVLEKHPQSLAARTLLARAYIQAEDWENCISEANLAENAAKGLGAVSANIYLIRAECYMRTNNAERALSEIDAVLKIAPQYADAVRFAGDVYLSVDKKERAKELYNKAISLNEKEMRAWYSLGCLYLTEKNYDEAETRYQRILQELGKTRDNPQLLADAITGLGIVRIARGETEGVMEHFEGALQIIPDHPVALYHLGMTAFANGDWKRANQVLKRYIEIDTSPDSEQRQQALAKLQMMKGFVK